MRSFVAMIFMLHFLAASIVVGCVAIFIQAFRHGVIQPSLTMIILAAVFAILSVPGYKWILADFNTPTEHRWIALGVTVTFKELAISCLCDPIENFYQGPILGLLSIICFVWLWV